MPGAGEVHRNPLELFVGACRSSGSKPLTYIPQSQKREEKGSSALQRSLTAEAAGKVKAVLGLKSRSKKKGSERENAEGSERKMRRSVGEVMRNQMRVSEQVDSRIRKVLLRIAADQLGRRFEALVLPLELLQHFRPSDFTSQVECEAWQKRNLKILELGLLLHPHAPLSKSDPSAHRLKQMISGFLDKPTWKTNDSMEVLRTVVMSLAGRSFGGSPSSECHWADGYPLNLRLYQMLLEVCFDINDETSIIEEVDEVLELIKKTWVVLGLNQWLHNICFLWILFHRYIESGETENDLSITASNLITEVEREPESATNLEYSEILIDILSVILGWAEKRLLTYHETFHSGNLEFMQSAASLGISAAKILAQYSSLENRKKRKEVDVARGRVEAYIRSSVRSAFAQRMEKISLIKRSSNKQQSNIPVLSVLAQEVSELAINEKETYSVVFKRWHPLAAGIAVATPHRCYSNELEQFVSSISELTPDAVQVLIAADKLEKHLVNIAVEDSADSDDGGKAIIKEMQPYEAEIMITSLVKSWIKTRLDVLKEWVDRNLQQETWNAQANKEHIAPSAIEVLRTVEETMEAFFLLPIPIQPDLVADLVTGTRDSYLPSMPALTRCSTGSKFFKKKEKFQSRKSQFGRPTVGDTFGIPQLCVRINTMQRVRAGVDYLEKKIITYTKNSGLTNLNYPNGTGMKMELTSSACLEGLQQLCEATALKVIFHELSHVLWDSMIEPVLQELEKYLEIIATTVHDRVRTRVITEVMKASFDGFLLVLLAGGPSRAFSLQDHAMTLEDFKLLRDLFWSNGDGLPTDLMDKLSVTVKRVLPLLQLNTESLIQQFRQLTLEYHGPSGKSGLPLPPTSGQWDPTEPNTLLR
ncbi:unc-13-like protein, partial [Drosera capensis]